MSAHKIVVVDSEKSPKVCSSNWREDVILKRNLQVLDRSQRTVVNRIMVDQKILKRRFQTKVNRSKMSYARATSNVEMQKKLRDETTFVLNTNVGHTDDDDEILQRIWDRGRRFYKRRLENDVFRKKKEIGTFTCIEDDTENEKDKKKNAKVPERPQTCIYLRPETPVVIENSAASRRPYTAINRRLRLNNTDANLVGPVIAIQRPQSTESKARNRHPDQNIRDGELLENWSPVSHGIGNVRQTADTENNENNPAQTKTEQTESLEHEDTKDGQLEPNQRRADANVKVDENEAERTVNMNDLEKQDHNSNNRTANQNEANPTSKTEEQDRVDAEDQHHVTPERKNDVLSTDVKITNEKEAVIGNELESDKLATGSTIANNSAKTEKRRVLPNNRHIREKGAPTETRTDAKNDAITPDTDEGKGTKTRKMKVKGRPATAGGFLKTMLDSSETSRARAKSAKASIAKTKSTAAGIGSMFEDDEFHISLLDFQRFMVYSANYEDRVKKYADRIKSLKADKTRAMDYYTLKLQLQTEKSRKMLKMEAARDATEEDIKRETGNLNVKSLTLKTVDPEFELKTTSHKGVPYL